MMTKRKFAPRRACQRTGAILPLVAVLLPILVIMASFAINITYMELVRTELQVSADAAARAASRTFADTGDESLARAKARQYAVLNEVAGEPLQLSDADIRFGRSTRQGSAGRYSFEPASTNINAVEVVANRSHTSIGGPISLVFPTLSGMGQASLIGSSISTQVEMDIALVVDRSGSMAYASSENSATFDNPAAAPPGWAFGDPVPTPSRWKNVESSIAVFLNQMQQTPQSEQVSLSTYGSDARIDVALTTDYAQIITGLDTIGQSFQEGMTNIGGGINQGQNTLSSGTSPRPSASKFIILLTDGIHNTGTSPEGAARQAFESGAIVHTITFSSEADLSRMQTVAGLGKGKHFHATSASELSEVFKEIARSLPTLIVD